MVNTYSPPLTGIRILDLSRVLAGPFCSMILGDLGAEVIKVEIPGQGDDSRGYPPFQDRESSYFLSVNRNKKSITLNLKTVEGKEVIYELVKKSDVILENFRPGVAKRLGLDYDTVRKFKPEIIYASISSFGQTGPYSQFPGYDLIIQGMGGLMGITGEENRPPVKIGVAITDIGAGMWAAIAILAALKSRIEKGIGQYIDISMFDGSIAWMSHIAGSYFVSGEIPHRIGSAHPSIVPYQAFLTKNKSFILVAAGNDRLFKILCEALKLKHLVEDSRFKTNNKRVENRDILLKILSEKFLKKTRDEWIEILQRTGFPTGPVYDIREIFSDPQVLHRKMLYEVDHPVMGNIKQIGTPMKFSKTPCVLDAYPPQLGEHTLEVLRNIVGYKDNKILKLKEEGVI
jgi:crotonobetainyl-CoA:carnitine CoA-transferase CaiB-like acyl-CoA transferase